MLGLRGLMGTVVPNCLRSALLQLVKKKKNPGRHQKFMIPPHPYSLRMLSPPTYRVAAEINSRITVLNPESVG